MAVGIPLACAAFENEKQPFTTPSDDHTALRIIARGRLTDPTGTLTFSQIAIMAPALLSWESLLPLRIRSSGRPTQTQEIAGTILQVVHVPF